MPSAYHKLQNYNKLKTWNVLFWFCYALGPLGQIKTIRERPREVVCRLGGNCLYMSIPNRLAKLMSIPSSSEGYPYSVECLKIITYNSTIKSSRSVKWAAWVNCHVYSYKASEKQWTVQLLKRKFASFAKFK